MASYKELVFEGGLHEVRAFLMGVKLAKGWSGDILFLEEIGVKGESLGHKVLEKLRLESNLTHVLVPERQADTIAGLIQEAGKQLRLKVRRARPALGAAFDYHVKVYNAKEAARLRQSLFRLPEGAERVDVEESEEFHPKGEGVEVYAPEHEYIFTSRGRVQGTVEAVVKSRDVLKRIEAVQMEQVRLVLG